MNEYLIPVTNSCTLITLSYVALKLRTRVLGGINELVLVPLFTGFSSILMMLLPIPTDLIIQDLRYIPIIMVGLRLGLPVALLSVIPPAIYTLWLNEPYLLYELLHGLLFPALISSFLHQKEYRSGFERIRLFVAVKISILLFAVKAIGGYFVLTSLQPNYLLMNGYMLAITLICLLVLIAMHNQENNSWLIQRQLELEANQDRLTGLPNLRSFLEIADRTLRKRRIGILMIDIDNFKNFNDSLGHLQGDHLLREAGGLLRATIGEKDYIARYGGEEFIVMCDSVDKGMLSYLAHKLCHTTADFPFSGREVQPGRTISISIGIAVADRAGEDLYKLIAEADQALYESKKKGKNRYSLFEGHDAAVHYL